MMSMGEFDKYISTRMEIAKSFLRQNVEAGSPEEAEQYMVRGRMLELESLLEHLVKVGRDTA